MNWYHWVIIGLSGTLLVGIIAFIYFIKACGEFFIKVVVGHWAEGNFPKRD